MRSEVESLKDKFILEKSQRVIIALCGVTGVGKTTLINEMLQKYPKMFLSKAATTRAPRQHELIYGSKYKFVSRDEFQMLLSTNQLLECGERYGNYYGELRDPLISKENLFSDAIIDTTVEGANRISASISEKVVTIGIFPPSMEELNKRIIKRDEKYNEVNRISQIEKFFKDSKKSDFLVINDNLEDTVKKICCIYESLQMYRNYCKI